MINPSKSLTIGETLRLLCVAGVAVFVVLTTASVARMQSKKPYDEGTLLRVVQLNALPTSEVVDKINERGVDFKMTAQLESDFRSAGARPEVIQAMRSNYRSTAAPSTHEPPPTTTRPSTNVPSGAPLSKAEIITMLQGGVTSSKVEQFVEVRGVSFAITPQIAREIKEAGGNNALIGAITAKASEPPSSRTNTAPPTRRPVPAGPDYDELTDKAVAAMQANNHYVAINLLQQAVTVDSSKPQAYGLLGFAQLYGSHDAVAAERSMRAAIERGGGAPFRVYHDHDGFFNTFCTGSLFVSKTNVTFKADDGNHTFEAKRVDIKEAKPNGFVGSQYGAFHLKVVVGSGKPVNYNFAPATRQKTEANLIIGLIESRQ
jgi:hypothetical protein